MEECIFCKIVQKEVPSFVVYEDEEYLAFMDIFPRAEGHVLVIPKKHYRWTYDVPEFGAYMEVVKKVGLAVKRAFGSSFFSMVTVGEAVHHAHVHILPQQGNDIVGIKFTEVITVSKEKMHALSEKLKAEF